MLPVFGVRALGIVEEEVIIMPSLEVAFAMLGARLRGVAAVAEFAHVSFTAMGAWISHCVYVQVRRPYSSSSLPFSKRSSAKQRLSSCSSSWAMVWAKVQPL